MNREKERIYINKNNEIVYNGEVVTQQILEAVSKFIDRKLKDKRNVAIETDRFQVVFKRKPY